MKVVTIHSDNGDFQQLVALRDSRRKRAALKAFIVEGVKAIDAALANQWPMQAVVTHEGVLSGWAEGVLRRAPAEVHYRVDDALMARLSGKDDPSELLLVARLPRHDLLDLDAGNVDCVGASRKCWLLFDRPASHGNLGSVMRTCDAFDVRALITIGHGVDPVDPAVISASIGTRFTIPLVHCESMAALRKWIEDKRHAIPGFQVIGSSAKRGVPVGDISATDGRLLMIGNEKHGLSRGLADLCDEFVSIEMRGLASSLNVSAATAILLHALT